GHGQSGTIRIDTIEHERPAAIDADSPDNRIIAVAWSLHNAGTTTVFITKDISARIKSDALGIPTEDFENQKVDADHLYNGYITADVDTTVIDELYRDRMLGLDRLTEALAATSPDGQHYQSELSANQFIVLRDAADDAHSGLGRRLADTDHIIPVTGPRKPVFGIMARNVQQTMALDLLLDDEIKFITLLGSAGTGKTLLAIAAGMSKVFTAKRSHKLPVA